MNDSQNNFNNDQIRTHIHDGNFSQRINLPDIFGTLQTVTTVPTSAPTDIYGQVVIYYDSGGGTWALYVYDFLNNVWKSVALT